MIWTFPKIHCRGRLADYTYTAPKSAASLDDNISDSMLPMSQMNTPQDTTDLYAEDMQATSRQTVTQRYKICADFRTDTTKQEVSPLDRLVGGSTEAPFTQHKAGETCFERS